MDSLVVDLNRGGPHSIETASTAFHAEGPFEIVLDNHGTALHVHLHLDDDLAEAVSLSAVNHFVDDESVRRVDVKVDRSNLPVRGRLKVVTGYGAESRFVTVTIDEPAEEGRQVAVDESLAEPKPRTEPDGPVLPVDPWSVPVVGVGVLAVLVAVLAVFALDGDTTLLVALILLVGVGIGAVLLRR